VLAVEHALEPAGFLSGLGAEDAWADRFAEVIVHRVAEDRGERQQPQRPPEVQNRAAILPRRRQRPHREQQAVPRQERHDHQARLDEDDREKQRIDPQAVVLDESLQELRQISEDFEESIHARRLRFRFLSSLRDVVTW